MMRATLAMGVAAALITFALFAADAALKRQCLDRGGALRGSICIEAIVSR